MYEPVCECTFMRVSVHMRVSMHTDADVRECPRSTASSQVPPRGGLTVRATRSVPGHEGPSSVPTHAQQACYSGALSSVSSKDVSPENAACVHS